MWTSCSKFFTLRRLWRAGLGRWDSRLFYGGPLRLGNGESVRGRVSRPVGCAAGTEVAGGVGRGVAVEVPVRGFVAWGALGRGTRRAEGVGLWDCGIVLG